jgi:molybdenum cofactor biosynthesis enzyme MoaA
MNSEKVKEIKKGLSKEKIKEILKKRIENINPWETHALEYHKGLLDLINELESENERIKNIGLNEDITVREWLQENQKLKDRIAELEKEKVCEHCQRVILGKEVYCLDCLNRFREIALKSFAERLKEKLKARHEVNRLLPMPVRDVVLSTIEGLWQEIDESLKECTGEKR